MKGDPGKNKGTDCHARSAKKDITWGLYHEKYTNMTPVML